MYIYFHSGKYILSLIILLFVSCIIAVTLPDDNGFCLASNIDCTDNGHNLEFKITLNKSAGSNITDIPTDDSFTTYSDCADLYLSGQRNSGVYTIKPIQLSKPIQVYCDMTEDGGGWTKLMRRQDGSVNFARRWQIYKNGFGELTGEHWLGNENISALTRQKLNRLRIKLWNFQNETRYADYSSIEVAPEWDKYRLHIGEYSGDAGDALTYSNGQKFSTIDQDNDLWPSHCAQSFPSGFWFKSCFHGCLTALYSHTPHLKKPWHGIVWKQWMGQSMALEKVEMKIRPSDF